MRLLPIRSSMIATIGFDPSLEKLVVQFQNGKVYEYNGVPEGTFVAILTDEESHGKAFVRLVRSKAFPFKEVKLNEAQES